MLCYVCHPFGFHHLSSLVIGRMVITIGTPNAPSTISGGFICIFLTCCKAILWLCKKAILISSVHQKKPIKHTVLSTLTILDGGNFCREAYKHPWIENCSHHGRSQGGWEQGSCPPPQINKSQYNSEVLPTHFANGFPNITVFKRHLVASRNLFLISSKERFKDEGASMRQLFGILLLPW